MAMGDWRLQVNRAKEIPYQCATDSVSLLKNSDYAEAKEHNVKQMLILFWKRIDMYQKIKKSILKYLLKSSAWAVQFVLQVAIAFGAIGPKGLLLEDCNKAQQWSSLNLRPPKRGQLGEQS